MKCLMRISAVLLTLFMGAPAFAREEPSTFPSTQPAITGIVWEKWSDDVFDRARREKKFVLLDLHAVWCHWCHVMDDTTYQDPAVIRLMQEKYIAVGVDADSRPDLSNRYEDYGWPATIVFGPDGAEIVKRRGYLPPKMMASMLQAIIDDPTPGPSAIAEPKASIGNQTRLTDSLRASLLREHARSYDAKFGGWGTIHKYLDWDSVEWCMRQAIAGDQASAHMARQTLDGQLNLIDPVWGGVYQYSTDGDWNHPHFEKIMQFQAEDLRIYSMAFAQWHKAADLKAAQDIHRFLTEFLRGSNGAFYTSQDADAVPGEHGGEYFRLDDAQRRAKGIPRIDQHQYARENGWAIVALTSLYATGTDRAALDQALTAAAWVVDHRALPGGGFRHDEQDNAGPYLGDTLAMGRAFLALYQVTADRAWLARAHQAADFVHGHFVRSDGAGVATADVHTHQPFEPMVELDENVAAARWANLLAKFTGRKVDEELASAAMRFLATPDVARKRHTLVAGILLADAEMNAAPLHIGIVGSKQEPLAQQLFTTAISFPSGYKQVEWLDDREGALPNEDVEYPKLGKPAAFLCANGACSRPAFTPAELIRMYQRTER